MSTSPRLALIVVLALVIAAGAAGAGAAPASAGAGPGAFVWTAPLDPTSSGDALYLCAQGPSATVYACGTQGWPAAIDIWLVKYTAAGVKSWSQVWAGPEGLADNAEGMAVDGAGNVFVCGSTKRSLNATDSLLLKYDASGTLQWAKTYDPEGLSDGATAIGLDSAGNVYLAGWSEKPGAKRDVYAAKFRSSDGERLWTSWYDSPAYDHAWRIAVTGAGVSYIIGESYASNGLPDALLVKTTATGHVAWAKRWNGPRDRCDAWEAVALSRSGSVCVAGGTDYLGSSDIVAARYSSSGKRLWLRTWGSNGGYGDFARDLAVDGDGNAWVAGYTELGDGAMTTALVRWNALGQRRLVRVIGSVTTAADLHAVTVDAQGNAYVAGTMFVTGGGWDLLAAKYSASGRRSWLSTWGSAGVSDDGLDDLVLGGPGALYGCGTVGTDSADSRGVLVKIRR